MIVTAEPGTATMGRVDAGGEKSRLERLYAAHGPRAVRTAYLMTGDAELAHDLVQDAFVKLAGRLRDVRSPDAFAAYLRRTVVNLVKNHWRRAELERRYLKRERRGPRPTAEMPDVETSSQLRDALATLGPRQRAAVVLRYFEDLSEAQVAEALGCSPAAAKSLIHRGTEALRARLRGEET